MMYAGVIEGLDLHATSGVIGRRKSEKGGKEKGGKQTVQQNEERQTQKEPEMSFPPFSFPLPFLSLSLSLPQRRSYDMWMSIDPHLLLFTLLPVLLTGDAGEFREPGC